MSTLSVDTITKADGTGALSVPAESGTVVTTASPSLGRRNLIINGAMQVAQRGTSFTGITNGSSGYKLDRWAWAESGTTSSVYTVEQASDTPEYFSNSFKVTCTTGATIDAGNLTRVYTSLEGQDLQQLAHGTSSAKTMTLSFWVKSNQTGVMIAWFYNPTSGRDYSSQVTINSADTWEYKTVTVTGDTTGSIPNTNGLGLYVEFIYSAGTNFTSGAGALDTWDTYDGSSRARGITLNVGATTGDYIAITGVQLEVGSVATPFEHRSYGEELALCQRYYWRTTGDDYHAFGSGHVRATTEARAFIPNITTMRARPSLSIGGTLRGNSGNNNTDVTTIQASWPGLSSNMVQFAVSGFTLGYGFIIHHYDNTSNYFQADAEL